MATGFFGGLAEGLASSLQRKKAAKHQQELQEHSEVLDFWKKVASSPHLKKEDYAIIFKNLGDLAATDPTKKQGKKSQQNILHQLSETLKGSGKTDPDLSKYGPEERPRSIKDAPRKPHDPFYQPGEREALEAKAMEPYDEEKFRRQLEMQRVKDEDALQRLEEKSKLDTTRQLTIQKAHQQGLANANVSQIVASMAAAAGKDVATLSPQELQKFRQDAGAEINQSRQDKHKAAQDAHNFKIQQIAASAAQVQNRAAQLQINLAHQKTYQQSVNQQGQGVAIRRADFQLREARELATLRSRSIQFKAGVAQRDYEKQAEKVQKLLDERRMLLMNPKGLKDEQLQKDLELQNQRIREAEERRDKLGSDIDGYGKQLDDIEQELGGLPKAESNLPSGETSSGPPKKAGPPAKQDPRIGKTATLNGKRVKVTGIDANGDPIIQPLP